jgi:hypothetical protein
MKVPSSEQITKIQSTYQKSIEHITHLASIANKSMANSDIKKYTAAINKYLKLKKLINNYYFKELI